MEVLTHYRTIRVRAKKSEWEQATRGHASEVQDFVRRGVERELRKLRKQAREDGFYSHLEDPFIVLSIPESGGPNSPGRSLDYWFLMIRANGLELSWGWPRNQPFDPTSTTGKPQP